MKKKIILLIFISQMLYPASLLAENTFLRDLNLAKKSEAKSSSRWTLEGWLAQKEKNKMMDLWLAMNQPSPYESSLGFKNMNITLKPTEQEDDVSYTVIQSSLAAYASFVGLEVDYLNNTKIKQSESKISLNLRILGNSIQSTHLIIGYGQKMTTYEEKISLRQLYLKGDLTIYLNKYFGIYGKYLKLTSTTHQTLGDIDGNQQEVGLFIDYSFVRIFGASYMSNQNSELNDVNSSSTENGVNTGFQIFF